MDKFHKKWAILAVVWFGLLIYALLFKQAVSVPTPMPHLDKVGHIGLFFGQFWLLARLLCLEFHHKKAWGVLLLSALLLAILTEFAQSLTTTRLMDSYDGLADMVGAVVALTLASYARQMGWLKD